MIGLVLWTSCAKEPIPLPPPPKPVQLTTTTNDYTQSRTYILKGWYHAHRNEWPLSRQSFLRAIESDPENPWTYIEHGNAEFEYGHIEEARAAWRSAKEIILPTQVELHTLLNNKIELAEP
tara:strand:- start:101 stop:463 length:363 start_codon:yes stop_codon:yes gene_type:complete